MENNEEVSIQDAANNMILLDEAIFEKVVDVFCAVMQSNKNTELRDRMLLAIDVGRARKEQEETYQKQKWMAQEQAQNALYPYQNQYQNQYQNLYQEQILKLNETEAVRSAQKQLKNSPLSDTWKRIFGLT